MSLCYSLHSQLEGHKGICDRKRLAILQIHFMLTCSNLMMRCLDLYSKILHCQYNITSGILSQIIRSQIKISGTLIDIQCRQAFIVCL